jgi:hypothetical protein
MRVAPDTVTPTNGPSPHRLASRVSLALAAVAAVAAWLAFTFWGLFHRDVPAGIGNMRGTALTVLAVAVPLLLAAMAWASRGSLRAQFVWLGCLAYLAYNAVMFCFAAHFNSLFLLFTTFLALAFWSLVTLIRALDLDCVRAASSSVPVRAVALYLLICTVLFALLWLQAIVPATLDNTMPVALEESGLVQNPVWVLDFAFTFPVTVLGSLWMWRRRPWGLIVGGMMTIMLTIETASIAVDQAFGHLHDPAAPLGAVPAMVGFTVAGLVFSILFLRGVVEASA